ncbi:flocculation protein FLO11-like isoform X2 [Gouania willdenowi]|uniref:flocculation protein FLO11-like isoform X2 n=1 Tax=Gouania willdenowi TaxID=441366 RepID=UPI001055A52D|nr:flocculation protein FLO11-like isoform X2 [Gouania willdenowi]
MNFRSWEGFHQAMQAHMGRNPFNGANNNSTFGTVLGYNFNSPYYMYSAVESYRTAWGVGNTSNSFLGCQSPVYPILVNCDMEHLRYASLEPQHSSGTVQTLPQSEDSTYSRYPPVETQHSSRTVQTLPQSEDSTYSRYPPVEPQHSSSRTVESTVSSFQPTSNSEELRSGSCNSEDSDRDGIKEDLDAELLRKKNKLREIEEQILKLKATIGYEATDTVMNTADSLHLNPSLRVRVMELLLQRHSPGFFSKADRMRINPSNPSKESRHSLQSRVKALIEQKNKDPSALLAFRKEFTVDHKRVVVSQDYNISPSPPPPSKSQDYNVSPSSPPPSKSQDYVSPSPSPPPPSKSQDYVSPSPSPPPPSKSQDYNVSPSPSPPPPSKSQDYNVSPSPSPPPPSKSLDYNVSPSPPPASKSQEYNVSPSPPIASKSTSPPAESESTSSRGFERFLNILNKGVDLDLLSRIVTDDTVELPDDDEILSVRQLDVEDASQTDVLSEIQQVERDTEVESQRGERHLHEDDRERSSGSRSKSPSSGKRREKTEEEVRKVDEQQQQQQQQQLQNVLRALGMSLEADELSQLSERTQERLYGRKTERRAEPERHTTPVHTEYSRPSSSSYSTSSNASRSRLWSTSRRSSPSPQQGGDLEQRGCGSGSWGRSSGQWSRSRSMDEHEWMNESEAGEEAANYKLPYSHTQPYPSPSTHVAPFSGQGSRSRSMDEHEWRNESEAGEEAANYELPYSHTQPYPSPSTHVAPFSGQWSRSRTMDEHEWRNESEAGEEAANYELPDSHTQPYPSPSTHVAPFSGQGSRSRTMDEHEWRNESEAGEEAANYELPYSHTQPYPSPSTHVAPFSGYTSSQYDSTTHPPYWSDGFLPPFSQSTALQRGPYGPRYAQSISYESNPNLAESEGRSLSASHNHCLTTIGMQPPLLPSPLLPPLHPNFVLATYRRYKKRGRKKRRCNKKNPEGLMGVNSMRPEIKIPRQEEEGQKEKPYKMVMNLHTEVEIKANLEENLEAFNQKAKTNNHQLL